MSFYYCCYSSKKLWKFWLRYSKFPFFASVTSYLPHLFHAGYFLCGSSCLEKIQEQCFSASKFQKPSKINVFLKPLLETFMKEVFVDTVFRYLAFLMASLTFNNSQKLLSDSWCSPLIHSFRPEKIDLKFAFFLLHWPTVSGILLALFWKPIFTKFPFFATQKVWNDAIQSRFLCLVPFPPLFQ